MMSSAMGYEIRGQGHYSPNDLANSEFTEKLRSNTPNELADLTDAQKFDVYASMARLNGNQAARDDLDHQDRRLILGLRNENYSTLNSMDGEKTPGKGRYDDRMVVLWTDAQGNRHVHESLSANTEPSAQYDEHARKHINSAGKVEAGQSPGYEKIKPRKVEGEDVNHDGVRDLGRLADGTYEMKATTHSLPRGGTSFAFRPTAAAVLAGHGKVQRDTNADGRFDANDVNGVSDLNDTFKIHSGSRKSNDSGGCQTIHRDEYDGFIQAATGQEHPNASHLSGQKTWNYVLTTARFAPPMLEQQQSINQPPQNAAPAQSPNTSPGQPSPLQAGQPPSDPSTQRPSFNERFTPDKASWLMDPDLQAIYNGEPGAFEKAARNYQQSPQGREFDAAAQAQIQEQNTQTISGRSR